MNVLILSNMKPSRDNPMFGVFVNNQFEALQKTGQFNYLKYLGIDDSGKGKAAVILKYLKLLMAVLWHGVFSTKRFDIVHVHYYFPTIFYAIVYKLLRNWRAKIVVTYHGSDVQLNQNPSGLYRKASNWVDHHIFVSQGLYDTYFKTVPNEQKTILSAGILDLYQQELPVVEKQFDVMMVGSLTELKGLDRLLALLDTIDTPIKVGIIGQGPYEEKIKTYQSQVHRVEFLGRCDPKGICHYLNRSRFLLSLSRHESFGLVMTEAMACGTPVIATKTNGSQAQIKRDINGYLLENTDDVNQFVVQNGDVISQYLQDTCPEQYANLSENAVNSAQRHRLSRVIEDLLVVYQRV